MQTGKSNVSRKRWSLKVNRLARIRELSRFFERLEFDNVLNIFWSTQGTFCEQQPFDREHGHGKTEIARLGMCFNMNYSTLYASRQVE